MPNSKLHIFHASHNNCSGPWSNSLSTFSSHYFHQCHSKQLYVWALSVLLVIKALVIYKGSWILEISDTTIVRLSRILAVIVVNLQHLGDSWLRKPAPGMMTKLLTGTDQQSYLRNGLFQLTLVLALLVSIIVLQVKKLAVSTKEAKEERKMLLAALPWSFLIVLAFIVVQMTLTVDQVGRFMLTSVVLACSQQIIPLY